MNNINILQNVDYNDSEATGRALARQAAKLMETLQIDPDPILDDVEGFQASGRGVEGLLADAYDPEHGEAPKDYDSLSDWEQHGILNVHPDTYHGMERAERQTGPYYTYCGDGAVGRGTYTLIPASCAEKVRARLAEKPKTAAELYREVEEEGERVLMRQRKRFERKYKQAQRTKANLMALLLADK